MGVLRGVERETVVGGPGDPDLLAGTPRSRAVVLLDRADLLAPGHPDEVLGRDPDERLVGDVAIETVEPGRRRSRAAVADLELLRADTEPDPAFLARGSLGGQSEAQALDL